MDMTTTLIIVGAVVFTLVVVVQPIRSMVRAIGPVRNGIAGTALLRGFREAGTTISAPNIGPQAPVYRLDLLVSTPAPRVRSRWAGWLPGPWAGWLPGQPRPAREA